jgi:hypothetical protein
MKLPPYMLVKLLHEVEGVNISIPGLPPSIIAIKPVDFTYRGAKGKSAKLRQFPVTLGYAITDYKCQGLTFQWVIADLKKPSDGGSPSTSPYVQLSRARNLSQVSIMRPFNAEELRTPHPPELVRELQRQEDLAAQTDALYRGI